MAFNTRFTSDYLVCPQCMELLTRDDVEGFGKCPYCDRRFEFENELEEFLLQPVVNHWIRQSQALQDNGMLE